jgi:predicted O-linked N-acetylglucosamine transferase (SPINDLY family)
MNEELLNGLEASLPHLPQLDILIESLEPIFSILEQRNPLFGASLTKILLESEPNNLYLLKNLFWYYTYAQEYQQAWELGKQIYEKAEHISLKVFTNYQILEMLLSAGHWLEAEKYAQLHQELLTQTIQENICPKFIKDAVLSVTRPLMYLEDKPVKNRSLHNQIARLFQEHTRNNYGNYQWWHQAKIKTDKKLKIGYIANSLRKHSVGWLSRWLFKYHNRDDFTINLYLVNQLEDRVTQQWFRQNADTVHALPANTEMVAERIKEDRIDILVDLDSITHHVTCQVMALKPAPIQITWLGLDASGIPSIDYFMADPYVLPKNAQNYYQETIWRLPHTYIAVDGFEVNLPTLRRNHLDIPDDAIIYLTAQSGFKRHPEHIRSSMQIIKQVPHSYLLIKGLGDQEKIQQIFTTIAQQEDVSEGRLRFLARDSAEEIHRANLQIADVVLDTYPYNGATTTLETLWMGIPLVTKVGKQFAARNSYAFMMNVGVTEGIAWTDEEYIKWGIKLGTEEKLRQQVAWKLSQSRKTSPLWNAQQFTREIEKAYQKMWDKYIKLSI